MIREINLFGVYAAPFVGDYILALLLFLPLRALVARIGALRLFWRPVFAEILLFACCLTLIAFLP
ncbi:hypothetical protein CCR94_05100 [Rhodoblastus sphagnicola]|uniref:DUF1656 domain-containing protein n=1 Tax=Rhodoblastus sphagnicola TaxID=333368 RepID=A0A2S6ND73_9HYPH|nr:DUF1656 domain-containing protein [Rhodoblastus sphagnicola]MBB4198005.1 hypothetical protein [Rhodoblastus sphagnicola]PPQ32559.1 hypothetical protein CCR94_05100 [Rhodoblastus sphagnicola]